MVWLWRGSNAGWPQALMAETLGSEVEGPPPRTWKRFAGAGLFSFLGVGENPGARMNATEEHEQNAGETSPEGERRLKVAIRIFDDRERWHLSQILTLAAPRSGLLLETVAAADADVVFINPDEPGSDLFIRNAGRGKRPLPVVYGGEAAADLPWLLKPARSTEMVPLLKSLPDHLDQLAPDAVVAPLKTERPPLLPTHDFVTALDLVRTVRQQSGPVRIQLGHDAMLIEPRSGEVYLPGHRAGPNLADTYATLASLPAEMITTIDRPAMVKELAARRVETLGLDELGWSLAFLARPAEPAPATVLEARVRLRHWPNFARLEHSQMHLVWAGMLVRQPLSLSALLARSPQGFAPVARFYNACALSGLLVRSDEVRKTQVVASEEKRTGIFRKILQKLAS